MHKAINIILTAVIVSILLISIGKGVFAQTDNSTNSTTFNLTKAEGAAGMKGWNQMQCNLNPSYCPGGMNAP